MVTEGKAEELRERVGELERELAASRQREADLEEKLLEEQLVVGSLRLGLVDLAGQVRQLAMRRKLQQQQP